MDIQQFVAHLSLLEQNWQNSPLNSLEPQFHRLLEQTASLTSAPMLRLLNDATSALAPGEVYCEVGCQQGINLIGALLHQPQCMAYAVEDVTRPNFRQASIDCLFENLTAFGLEEQVLFCGQSCEEFFAELRELGSDDRIGVYVYCGETDYRSQMLGLMLAQSFLADQSVVLISQGALNTVRQATWDFLAAYPQARLLHDPLNETQNQLTEDDLHQQDWLLLSWDASQPRAQDEFDWQHYRDRVVIDALCQLLVQQPIDHETLRKEAVQLHLEGQLTEAEQRYRTILECDQQNAEIWFNLGMLYHLAENNAAALEALQQSLTLQPKNALAYHISGLVLERMDRLSEAVAAYQQAIALDAAYIDTLYRLGNLLVQNGAFSQAEALFRQAIAVAPNEFTGHLSLGDALMAQQKPESATVAYRQALMLKQRDPDILQKIGEAYAAAGDSANAHNYFAHAFNRAGNPEAAIEAFQSSLALAAGTVHDYLTLGDCYQLCGQLVAAIDCIYAAANLEPDDPFLQVLPQLVLPPLYRSVEEMSTYYQRFKTGLTIAKQHVEWAEARQETISFKSIPILGTFYLAYQAVNVRDLQALYGQLLQRAMRASHPNWLTPLAMPPIPEGGKIRIGYLADSMGTNSMSHWALGWLQHHDRSRFEIYCYNTGSTSNRRTEQFKALSDVYRYIPNDLQALGQQLLADNLHILVFLAIGTHKPTAMTACLRLAPVQCSTWGHPVTSGIPTIDYYLSGALIEPDNAQEHYTERLIRLPNLGISYPQPIIPAPTKTRADFGIDAQAVLYMSCQMLIKYLPQHDGLFAAIAQRVPQAKFVFIIRSTVTHRSSRSLEHQFRQRLQQAFVAVGLDSDDYCVFLPGQNWEDYTSLLLDADVFLDTPDFSGGHTTFDAIACNLPIVSHAGEFMRGRQSCGMLTMMGITETIAQNEAEYVEIAVRLGLKPEWRQAIAQQMSERQHRLFNDTDCVRGLEQFYQQVVATKLAQQHVGSAAAMISETQTVTATKLVLHVGCEHYNPAALPEPLRTPDWREVRLDIDPSVKPDLIGSMTDMSAVLNESVDAVYSSHNLKHLYAHEVPIALAEFYRVLKPGGFVLITLPDIQAVAQHVAQGNLEEPLYGSSVGPSSAIDILYGWRTAIANGNHSMAHRTAFTAKTLCQKLEQTGFHQLESYTDRLNLWAKGYK
ncbi:tetratricopeptide repeat protein [Stenomitos frigidus]|uniref:protein O-GlcNAc transferase n=1 Tax=Stenomitos frigidus ULC18 TaxID=2107698 RepID=A0A2T1DYQ7_9CYAN|nr:tetratricopeptide repeat protein [Stenomitos frigidus]PSB25636.1 glycosyltransferase [Stenomitos frigidus ULC18]